MTTHANSTIYKVGRWHFEPTLNRLCDEAVVVELEPIASRLLEVLCSAPGEVFSADELVTRVWGDRIVSDNPIYKAMANLRKSLGEKSGGVRYIETIRKRGYRLVAEVESIGPATQTRTSTGHRTESGTNTRRGLWVGIAIAFAILVAIMVLWPSSQDSVEQDVPLVVVLPFETGPGFGDVDYVGSGLARSVASSLATAEQFDVVGDTSTTTMFDRLSDPRETARSLGARFAVYGIVSQADERLSLQLELVDVRDESRRWAAMFEQALRAEPYIQWEVANAVTERITGWTGVVETLVQPSREQTSFQAYELHLRSLFLATRGGTEQLLEAEQLTLDALALDNKLVAAMCALASIEYQLVFHGLRTPEAATSRLAPWLQKALALEPDSSEVHVAVGKAKQVVAAHSEAEQAFRTALRTNPSHSGALQNLAWMLFTNGRLQEATPMFSRALGVDPASPMLMVSAGMNAESRGSYDCAKQLYSRAVSLRPSFPNGHFALGQFDWLVEGDLDSARSHFDRALALDRSGPITRAIAALAALDGGDIEQARSYSALAFELAPNTYWPRRARMSIALFEGNLDLGLSLAEVQLTFSEDQMPLRALRDAALQRGDTAGAVDVYPSRFARLDSLGLGNDDVTILADYAFALAADGQSEEAERTARKVLQLAQMVPHHARDLAEVVAAEVLGNRALALDKLSMALADRWQPSRWWYWDRDPALASLRTATDYDVMVTRTAPAPIDGGLADQSCRVLYGFDPPPLIAAADQ
ncbi:MAG: winged helix-turn-helix domain-containing protein [Pseudomonadota bacterium]